ncbi:unnamed protein product [Mytilus coruscus]|uniref:Fe2OG dioxygenase domain-containing protein n=1 Tax=Mytilus coruscus TaxID=42192 RepID=A0A6J8EQP1_MYTCO|nr:unnamed protein product [Mytilus coruscus]
MSSIPVIDFQKYGLQIEKADSVPREDLKELGDQMCQALQNIGFCYLKNHGVPDAQPLEEKKKNVKPDEGYDGWIGLEKENLNLERPVGDYKETYNITPICEKWPTNIPEFETVLMDFLRKCIDLALRVFDVISVDKNFFRNCHKLIGQRGNVTALRSLFYPAIPIEKEIMEGQVRCGEHSDYGTLTLLFQDIVGKTRDGDYIPATPISSTIVVNIGDMMQRWTADKPIATVKFNFFI